MSANHLTPEMVGGFVDGELSIEADAEARLHLQECHACTLRVLAAHQMKSATKRAGRQFTPSATTLARLTLQAKQKSPKLTHVVPFRTIMWGSVAALFLAVLSLAAFGQWRQDAALGAELLDQHLASLSASASPQVISTDRHTVKPWFQGKLPFSFNLPEPKALPGETVLQGADLTYVEGKPAAMLLFYIHKHRASIFITQAGQLPNFGFHTTRSGFNLSRVRAAGLELAAVSDVNRSELDSLAAALARCQ